MNRKQTISRKQIKPRNQTLSHAKPSPLHPRNPHAGRYDFNTLVIANEELKRHIIANPSGDNTINFRDEKAVLCLNKALLQHYYHIEHWNIPKGYLCPPIPGRADYIHYLADLLAKTADQKASTGNQVKVSTTRQDKAPTAKLAKVPTGKQIRVLDIGTGANCIYPIIGSQSYGWEFVGAEIDPLSVETANLIAASNACLANKVTISLQKNSDHIFRGIIKEHDRFSLTLCNPPFHSSMEEALSSNQRKWKNLNKGKSNPKQTDTTKPKLNFGGQKAELWCPGGEITFLKRMAGESVDFRDQVCWFTTLVSKGDNIGPMKGWLRTLGVKQIKVVSMSQGQKISRFIAWSFLNKGEQNAWTSRNWDQ